METLLNINTGALLFTLAINLGLSLYIYVKDPRNEVSRSFSAVLFFIAFWAASFLAFSLVRSLEWILFWRRFTPVGSALLAGYILYFSLVFPKRVSPLSSFQKSLILGPGYVFTLFSIFTSLMVKSFTIQNPDLPFLGIPHFGPLYKFYALYIVLFIGSALVILFQKFIKSAGREKLQIFYVLAGVGLSALMGIGLSLLLPLFGFAQFFMSGPPFTLILVAFITYAIVRHRLLDMEDFLSRGLIFLTVVSALTLTVVYIAFRKFSFILPTYTVLVNFATGAFVYFQDPKSRINRSFFAITLAVVLWTLAIFMSVQSIFPAAALFWSKVASVAISFLPPFFIYFCYVFPREELHFSRTRLFSWFVPAVIFVVLTYSNQVVSGAAGEAGKYQMFYGVAFPLLFLYFVAYMSYGFYILVRKNFISTGISKIQIRYVFLGFLLGTIPGAMTNLVLPLFGHTQFRGLAPSFTIVSFIVISYAIVKHRLMSIELVIQRSAVYGAATVLIMALYALAVIVSETFLRNIMGYTSLVVTAAAALLIAVVYQPLVRSFQSLTDRIFFRGRYDYQKTLREISQKIASVIRLEELTRLIVSSFVDTMKVSEISFLLLEKEKEHFRSVPLSFSRYKRIEIDVESPVVSWIIATKDILVRDEVDDEISRQEALGQEGKPKLQNLREVLDEMDRLGISIWVPIVSKDELIGIIALGKKLSGDLFSTEDIGLLSTLANQTAVALDNARLYDEVVNMKDYSEEILQSMVSGVLTVDNKGKVVTYNYMAEKICGRKSADVLGKVSQEIWGNRGTITKVVASSLKDKCYVNYESSIASPERGLVPVSFSSTLLRDHQGKKMGALITIQDLSEVKELEGKVRRADKLAALATMAAGMAHEIKNPLSSMKVLSQLLPIKFQDPEYRAKMQEILPREINRIDRIVESLLGFARATAPTFERADIRDVLNENLKYFKDQAQAAEVKVVTKFADLPEIEIDQGQLSQVFSNLMLNAIQAMPNGGELQVITLPGKEVEEVLQEIKVQISDTGHGISEDMAKKLFDPFFTTKYGGTGLGLTISHSIVDGHKGYIDVESKIGKGTTFIVTLPVSQGLL